MANYKTIVNPFTGQLQLVNDDGILFFKGCVANVAALPGTGNTKNDARIVNDTHHLYVWSGTAWVDQGDALDIDWSTITNRPTSSVVDIDSAVAINNFVSEVVYVDGNRVDVYVENGSLTKPFKTIQAAINAHPYGIIKIAPMLYGAAYDENIVCSGLFFNLTFQGDSSFPYQNTIINASTGNTLTIVGHLGRIFFENISIGASPPQGANIGTISIAGENNGTAGIYFNNCSILDPVNASCLQDFRSTKSYFRNLNLTNVQNISHWEMTEDCYGALGRTNFSITIDLAQDKPLGMITTTYLQLCGVHDIQNIICTELNGGLSTLRILDSVIRGTLTTGTSTCSFTNTRLAGTITNNATLHLMNCVADSGSITNNGTITLKNSKITTTCTLVNNGTISLFDPSSQILNDSAVSGVSVTDALNTLGGNSHASGSDDQTADTVPTDDSGISVQDTLDALETDKADKHVSINNQTDDYTLQLSDDGKTVTIDSSSGVVIIAVTVPKNSVVAFPIGTTIAILQLTSAASVTITPVDIDVTILVPTGLTTLLKGDNSMVSLVKIDTNTWALSGYLATP
jgi:hypothetical protein